jgi:hypothetical protein
MILKLIYRSAETVLKVLVIYMVVGSASYFLSFFMKSVQNEWLFLFIMGGVMGLLSFAAMTCTGVVEFTKCKITYYAIVATLSPGLLIGFYFFFSHFFTETFYIPMPFLVAFTSILAALVVGICGFQIKLIRALPENSEDRGCTD